MGRSKSRRAGALLTDEQIASGIKNVENKLNAVQISLNNLKEQLNTNAEGPIMQPEGPIMQPEGPIMQPEGPIMQPEGPVKEEVQKPWQNNKDMKFSDGANGRVTLSFPRLIMLLDNNIKQNNTNKPWTEIKTKLLDATSIEEVKKIIKDYSIRFSANSVGGTKK
jgi:hypothetical protein